MLYTVRYMESVGSYLCLLCVLFNWIWRKYLLNKIYWSKWRENVWMYFYLVNMRNTVRYMESVGSYYFNHFILFIGRNGLTGRWNEIYCLVWRENQCKWRKLMLNKIYWLANIGFFVSSVSILAWLVDETLCGIEWEICKWFEFWCYLRYSIGNEWWMYFYLVNAWYCYGIVDR